jgi:hypothetical protein
MGVIMQYAISNAIVTISNGEVAQTRIASDLQACKDAASKEQQISGSPAVSQNWVAKEQALNAEKVKWDDTIKTAQANLESWQKQGDADIKNGVPKMSIG